LGCGAVVGEFERGLARVRYVDFLRVRLVKVLVTNVELFSLTHLFVPLYSSIADTFVSQCLAVQENL
jgi:hypothetical protein